MKFNVEFTLTALAEIEKSYNWLLARSATAADRWKDGIFSAIDSLESRPLSNPFAPEAENRDRNIRQLLHGKRRGVYRILYEVRDQNVYVLHVRHGAQRFLHEGE